MILTVLFLVVYQLLLPFLVPWIVVSNLQQRSDWGEARRLVGVIFAIDVLKWIRIPLKRNAVLIHAVSYGEAKVAAALSKKIAEDSGGTQTVYISTFTATAFNYLTNHESLQARVLYNPIDFFLYNILLVVGLGIKKFIVIEHDIWPMFMMTCGFFGVEAKLINANFSQKTISRYKQLKPVTERILGRFNGIYLQNADVLSNLGKLEGIREKCILVGNLKMYTSTQGSTFDPDCIKFSNSSNVCFASCHLSEFDIVAKLTRDLVDSGFFGKIILVPRHPDKAKALATALERCCIPHAYTTNWNPSEEEKVVIVAQMGVLNAVYQCCDVAVVCGSFCPLVGGHNVLEPFLNNCVSLYGPYIHSQLDLHNFLVSNRLSFQFPQEKMNDAIRNFINNPQQCRTVINTFLDQHALHSKKIALHIDRLASWCCQ